MTVRDDVPPDPVLTGPARPGRHSGLAAVAGGAISGSTLEQLKAIMSFPASCSQ